MPSMILYSMVFGFFIIMIIFISLDKGTGGILLNDTMDDLNVTNTTFSQNVRGTVSVISSVWLWIPLFALFGLIYYAFSGSHGGEGY